VPGLYRNDALPDCTAAGLANARRAAGWVLDGADRVTTEDAVVRWFAATAGVAPTDAAMGALDGLVMLDVLETARDSGFDLGGQVPEVPLFASIDPADRMGIAHATATLGCAYLGIDLYAEDVAPDAEWSQPPVGDAVGGHCLLAWDYAGLADTDTVRLPTWGALMPATWVWLQSRLREAFAVRWA
jgi:hypothetical protein